MSMPESPSPAPTIRVLIADDHFMARIGLATAINEQSDMTVVGEARNGAEAIALFEQHRPDVMILDYRLPDSVGPEIVRDVREESPGARVLLLSAFEAEEHIYRAVQSGVCGYLTKDTSAETVLEAVRRIYAGGTVFPEALARKAEERSKRRDLTPRELDILRYLASGCSNKEIASRLGYSESLIKQELVRTFDCLGAKDRAHAATLAIERGLVELDLD